MEDSTTFLVAELFRATFPKETLLLATAITLVAGNKLKTPDFVAPAAVPVRVTLLDDWSHQFTVAVNAALVAFADTFTEDGMETALLLLLLRVTLTPLLPAAELRETVQGTCSQPTPEVWLQEIAEMPWACSP